MRAFAILLISFKMSFGATIIWDGGANTSNWADAANWSSNTLPSILDSVVIQNDTVSLTGIQGIKALMVSTSAILTINPGATLELENGTHAISIGGSSTIINLGFIDIKNPTIYGIFSVGSLLNYGTIKVYSTSINSAAKGINLLANAVFENYLSGILILNDLDTGIYSYQNCTIDNFGQIYIDNARIGFHLLDQLENYASATIVINAKQTACSLTLSTSSITNAGLIRVDSVVGTPNFGNGINLNAGTITNTGTMEILHCKHDGLFLSSSAILNNTGVFLIDGSSRGIVIQGGHTFQSGNMLIRNTSGHGISFQGQLVNLGLLEVNNANTFGIWSISSPSDFHNMGTVKMNSIASSGVRISGTFRNEGIFHAKRTGLSINAQNIVNQNLLKIEKSQFGIMADSLFNVSKIEMDSVSTGINAEIFRNVGTARIDSALQTGIIIQERLTNEDSIIITKSLFGLQLNDSTDFQNENSGYLQIINVDTGVRDLGFGMFHNKGIILLDSSRVGINLGWRTLRNFGKIESINATQNGLYLHPSLLPSGINELTGEIEISNSLQTGLLLTKTFYNLGDILVSESTVNSIIFSSSTGMDTLINSGGIQVQNTVSLGVLFLKDASLVNSGIISLDGTPVNLSFNDFDPFFLNTSSGTLETNSTLSFQAFPASTKTTTTADHRNNGVMHQRFMNGSNSFTNFKNNGVFLDENNAISLVDPGFQQNAVLLKPLRGTTSAQIKERGIVHLAAGSPWEIAQDWYAPTNLGNLTRPIGTYSSRNSFFLPNENGHGSFKFTVKHTPTNRNYTIILQKDSRNCPSLEPISFTQSVSTDWFNPLNWSTGKLPNDCSKVSLTNKKVIIESGSKARVQNILNTGTGTWLAEDGSVVEIGM